METLTYNYGETPTQVIADRLEWDEPAFILTQDPETFFTPANLLTVLIALRGYSKHVAELYERYDGEYDEPGEFRELRISILSALGIEEV